MLLLNADHPCEKQLYQVLYPTPTISKPHRFFRFLLDNICSSCVRRLEHRKRGGSACLIGSAKKILERNRNKERRKEEKELKARQERVRQAQEAQKRGEQEDKQHADGAGSFGGFSIPKGLEKIFQDPEVMSLLQDEAMLAAYMDIINNPANIAKHMSNPKVMKLFSKIGNATGGFHMGGGNSQMGQPADDGTTNMTPPNKAPEPDLD
uniref:STI1 domain-containing protein n=1 Tax=Setaria digitata TaxID=48799 RepID=A0A915PB31_9BILA